MMITLTIKRIIFSIGLFLLMGASISAQVPLLVENFNDCALPSNWTVNVMGTEPSTWQVGEPQNSNSDGSTIDGTCMLIIDDDAAGNNTPPYVLQFVSPVFDGTQYSTLKLNIDVHFREVYGTSLKIFVNNDGQLQEVVSFGDGQGTGEQFSEFVHVETDISFFASQQMSIVIQYDDNDSWGWWAGVDNLLVLGEGSANNVILENFNTCELPEGWTAEIESGDVPWQFGLVTNDNAGTNVSMNGTCFAYFDDDILGQTAAPSTVRLYSPEIDGTQYGKFYLDFDLIFRKFSDLENVSILIDDGVDVVSVETFLDNYGGPDFTSYLPVHLDLSPYRSQTMRVVFQYDDGDDWGWWAGIDNVKISGEGFLNDLCSNAMPLQLGGNCMNGDNRNAIFEGEQPSCSTQNVGGLWYQYESNYTGILKLESQANFNDVITVFTGTCNALAEPICSNRDEHGFSGETVYMEVVAGQTYFIRISGQNESFGLPRGNFCLSLEQANAYPTTPANDNCSDAQLLSLGVDCLSGNNFNANFDGPAPSLNRKSRADIWYLFEAPSSGEIEILSNANFSDVLTLYSGTCGNLTEVAGNDAGQSLRVADLIPGNQYYVQVAGYFATLEGSVCMLLQEVSTQVVGNDLCSEAWAIGVDGNCVEAQNQSAAFEGPNLSCEIAAQASIWFQFVAPASGAVKMNTGADFVHSLGLFAGDCNELEEVFCTQNPLNCDGYFQVGGLNPGQTYFVQIASASSGFGHQEGSVCLSILDQNTLEENPPLQLQVSVECNGMGTGQLIIEANGGVGNYTFEGNTTDEILTTGESYLVIVMDEAGCQQSWNGQIDCGLAPCNLNTEVLTTNVNCFGAADGTASLMISAGIAPYTYQWSNDWNLASANNLEPGTYTVTVADVNDCQEVLSFLIQQPDLLIGNATASGESAANANDGVATVNPSGGVGPYQVSWNTGANTFSIDNLSPDLYTVSIVDANGCSVEETVVVSSFDCGQMTVDIQAQATSCFDAADGTATAFPTNGQAPYQFVWSTGVTSMSIENLSAGWYGVTIVDANDCPTTSGVLIESPELLEAAVSQLIHPTCFEQADGMVELMASGGTTPYTFLWSDGFTGASRNDLAAGIYTIAVQDANACSQTLAVTIEEATELTLSPANIQGISCPGLSDGSATVIAIGGQADYTYLWNDPQSQDLATAIGLTAGEYIVTVTDDEGCTADLMVQIGSPSAMELTVDGVVNATGNNEDGAIAISVLEGLPPYQFNWFLDGTLVSNEEDPSGLAAGIYTVQISDSNSCLITSDPIEVETTTNISDPMLAEQIFIMPNPTAGKAVIEFALASNRLVSIQVTDVVGRLLLEIPEQNLEQGSVPIDLGALAAGVYPVKIFVGDKMVLKRVVVSR